MTDTARMVVWLRETLDAAERDAAGMSITLWLSAAMDFREKIRHPLIVMDPAVVGPYFERVAPEAVLRQIDRHRKLLDDLELIVKGDYIDDGELPLAESVIRDLAEGYGWTQETADADTPT